MKLMLAAALLVATAAFTGCSATNDARTGLRGELCAFGFCVAPSAMSASSVAVVETAPAFGGAMNVAPATVLSQPVVANSVQPVAVASYQAQACAPVAAPALMPPAFNSYGAPPQLSK